MFTSSSLSSTIAIILAFLIGILLYILKFKFALKIWIAKTHVKVFNHSLALCLFVSGNIISDRPSKSNLTPSSPIILHRYFQGLVLWFVSQFQYCFLKKREATRKNLSKTSLNNVLNRTSLKYDITFTLTTTECRPFIFGRVQKLNLSLTYLNAHLASIFSFFVFVFMMSWNWKAFY